MDDPVGEDDDYSDDDLDALPDQAFHQLQQNAIQSTQQPSLSAQVQLPTIKQPTGLATSFGRLSVTGPASHAANQSAFQAPSSDYGDFDDDMLDGEIFDAAEEPDLAVRYISGAHGQEPGEQSQREQTRLQRYGPNQRNSEPIRAQQRVSQQGMVGVPLNTGNGSESPNATVQNGSAMCMEDEDRTRPPPQETTDVNALQAQVQKVGFSNAQIYRLACLSSFSAAK